ncbi:hydantoinase/oxoprolinase N-terminal domain-containing protein [Nonomuraea gerenzanensis]|uniref:N-methylhydantoinase (ATP-hydrolyzing) n=1 Tax=Nonomuraea gerenzanensis TaxID=93944 RepID=A0A1M4EMS5_9ACTN|nr:hydantoinase/oxoprolinase family protein [Nonomuraea gerenzanensis]UBU11643.1 hydantoinase/oxoprolinase family protein [Nonomuraea gerenzanensis]SBP00139.1 N-methylhydantoinase (ATP-hydrolyzing) [Nonomuraea gerenzanensis]
MADLKIGIDVGGTNTDAVVLDADGRVIAKAKRPTSPDVTDGLRAALDAVLAELDDDDARRDSPAGGREGGRDGGGRGDGGRGDGRREGGRGGRESVTRVMLGTTHATNAILERRGLGRVAVIRLGAPATTAVPPLCDWPDDLRKAVSAGEAIVPGGHYVDGREISPLDLDAIRRFLDGVRADAVAVTSVFSPADDGHERRVEELVRAEYGLPVSVSSEIGSLGLLERENATVLNAALYGVAAHVVDALVTALAERGLGARPYLAQNDGTLMTLEHAARLPVSTIGSGPANSLRGAAYLSGVADAVVVDVGGTSTDLGVLAGGFPRESAAAVEIGGVLTNFRMPDILAIALGGGTVVRPHGLGPDSVGYRIGREALVFGGTTATMTDAAVAAGRVPSGGETWHDRLRGDMSEEKADILESAVTRADEMVIDAVDRMTLGRTDRPLVAVGGGAFLLPDRIPGVSRVIRPEHAEVANAVGAAIALASGRVDTILPAGDSRSAAIDGAKEEARARAVAAGADPAGVEIVDLLEVPLSYLSEPAVRVHVKAAGPLAR